MAKTTRKIPSNQLKIQNTPTPTGNVIPLGYDSLGQPVDYDAFTQEDLEESLKDYTPLPTGDILLKTGFITTDGTDVTIDGSQANREFRARINNTEVYSDVLEVVEIDPTSTGLFRRDRITLNLDGLYNVITGTAGVDSSAVVLPTLPADNITIGEINVNDTGVSTVFTYIDGAFVPYSYLLSLSSTQRLNARNNIQALSKDTSDSRTGVLTQNGNMFIVDSANQDALRITQNLSAGRCLTLRKPGASGSDMVRYINNIDTTPETVYQFTDVGLAIYKFAPQFNNRSNGITRGVRRDELYLNYLQTIGTDGILNNLAISEDTKLLILTEADELTGVVPSTTTNGRLLRIQASGTSVIIRNNSVSSSSANRFDIRADITINTGQIVNFIYTAGKWRLFNVLQLFDNGTNVGIGTNSPTAKFDVVDGDAKINGLTVGRGSNNLAENTVFGFETLQLNTTGNFNTVIGYRSLRKNTTGRENTAIGYLSLSENTTGRENTSIGFQSLRDQTTGRNNTAIGYLSLFAITSGNENTAIGDASGGFDSTTFNTVANNSVFLGFETRALASNQTNQIVIGHKATGAGSNSVVLGNDSIVTTLLKGNVGLGITPTEKLDVNGKARIRTIDNGTGDFITTDNNGVLTKRTPDQLLEDVGVKHLIIARGTRTQTGNFQPVLVNNGTTPFNLFQSNFSWLSSYYGVGTKIVIEISGRITLPDSENLVFSLNIGGTDYTASNLVISASSSWVVRYTITISSTTEIKFNGVRMSQNSIITGEDFINVNLNNNLDIYVQGEFSADSATNAITSNLISIDVIK